MVSIRFNGLYDRHRQEDGKKGGQEDEHKSAGESRIERSKQETRESKYKRPGGLSASAARAVSSSSFRPIIFFISFRTRSDGDSGPNAVWFNHCLYKSTSRISSGGPKKSTNQGNSRPPNDAISATRIMRLAATAKMLTATFPIPLLLVFGVFSITSINATCTSCRVSTTSAQIPIGSPSSDPGLGTNCKTPAATANPYD